MPFNRGKDFFATHELPIADVEELIFELVL
jgi:hypothetical protein